MHSRWLQLTAVACIVAIAAAVVALGPLDVALRDRNRNVVLLAWDDASARLVVNEAVHPPLQLDGPYVRRLDGGRIEILRPRRRGDHWIPERQVAPASAPIEVVVDNPQRTRFQVTVRAPAISPPDTVRASGRVLLLSDLDGDFDAFADLLIAQGVIDSGLHWRFGNGQLVVAGDFMDDGPNILPLLWLLYRLEPEAERAGGRVHVVLGNHELLLLAGRFSAAPQRMFASRDAFFGGDNRRVFAADTVLGQWLRARPVIVKVGDTLVVHGGVSEVFLRANLDMATANAIARRELDVERDRVSAAAAPVIGRWGVPWYRGLALPHDRGRALEAEPVAHLEAVLRRYGVRRVAIGHTGVPQVVLEQGGRLLRLDVDQETVGLQAALLVDGSVWRVDVQGRHDPLR
ncbi:metallophosphoesterase [Lysobacter terrae]